ncbi:hypothetical protein BH09PLA1_BH09PLA1_21830 [soil metagenome]
MKFVPHDLEDVARFESTSRNRMALIVAAASALAVASSALGEDRTIDGTGNNPLHLTWAAAGTGNIRLSPAGFGNGFSTPAGATRPNPRAISNAIIAQSGSLPNSFGLSDWTFQWGQFIDHDLTLTQAASPTEAFNIPIPAGDPIFDAGNTGNKIMPFNRSAYFAGTGTSIGNPRAPVNTNTSYLDGSMVYGSDAPRALALRTLSGGRMKTSAGNLLPLNTMNLPNDNNGDPNPAAYYVAGDPRANEQMGLTAVHTLFLREHNRQADQLAAAHPTWTDDQIYQQARKIVSGEVQAITFKEFLPALMGSNAPALASVYNPNINASISVEFATAFFRVGHTMLSPQLPRMQNDGTPAPGGPVALRDTFFQQENMAGGTEVDYFLKGLASERQQEIDQHVVDDVRNFLVGDPIAGFGFDLPALNIQRGRDHGLADYNASRVAYGLAPAANFSDITSDPALQQALQNTFGDVNNIDAWVGALSEDHVAGMRVGELIGAAFNDQFTRLRDGDRFWFLNDDALSPAEKTFLSGVRLSDIIRANSGITNIQDNVFMTVPEPAATALLLAACGGTMLNRRRRRASHSS